MLAKKVIVATGLMFAIFWQVSAVADDYESAAEIKTLVKEFIVKNVSIDSDESIDVKINQSDMPAHLAACSQPVEIAFPKESSREQVNAVELSCNGARSWHTFLPVNVQINTKVLVAKRTVTAHEILTADDLDYAQYDRNRLYGGFFKDKNEVVGQVAGRLITAGTAFTKRNIQQPLLIHRNQSVDLIAKSHSVMVTMKGIAKSDGSLNEAIKIYNPASKRIVDGVVVGSNKVEVLS